MNNLNRNQKLRIKLYIIPILKKYLFRIIRNRLKILYSRVFRIEEKFIGKNAILNNE